MKMKWFLKESERERREKRREREREEKRREKVEAYTPLHKDAFVQQSAWEKCALPQNNEFILTFFTFSM